MNNKRPQTLRILGSMTGTSCDGIDAACIEVGIDGWAPLWSATAGYPAALRKRVLSLQEPHHKTTTREVLELDRDLGEWYGRVLNEMIESHPLAQKPHVVANHGQTVAHFPSSQNTGAGMTWQMGDPTRIVRQTGLTTITRFRDGDLASGGQGAPLVSLFHSMLAERLDPEKKGIAFHNIGGISNLTYVSPPSPRFVRGEIVAFDTGPGNAWIDAATERATQGKSKFDRGGKRAALGTADMRTVRAILKNKYFSAPAPKSTGRDDFPFQMLRSKTRATGNDLIATATQVTIESIAMAYEQCILRSGRPLGTVFVCGGGAQNPTLMQGLRDRLPGLRFNDLTDFDLDPQLIESQAFAFFGWMALMGQPIGGHWTGVRGFGSPAHIVPGPNWQEVLTLSWEMRSLPKKIVHTHPVRESFRSAAVLNRART